MTLVATIALSAVGNADDSSPVPFLKVEQRRTNARIDVLNARHQLLVSRLQALKTLHSEGHASRREMETARVNVQSVQAQLEACRRHLEFLPALQAADSTTTSREVALLQPTLLLESIVSTPVVIDSRSLNLTSERLSEMNRLQSQIVRSGKQAAKVKIKSLQQQLQRENKVACCWNAQRRKNLAHQIRIEQASRKLIPHRSALLQFVSLPRKCRFGDREVSPETMVHLVANHWNQQIIETEIRTLDLVAQLHRSEPPSGKDPDWLANGETEVTTRQASVIQQTLLQLQQMRQQLQADGKALAEGDLRFADDVQDQRYAQLLTMSARPSTSIVRLNEMQRHLQKLKQLKPTDLTAGRELAWCEQQFAFLKRQQQETEAQLAVVEKAGYQPVDWTPGFSKSSWSRAHSCLSRSLAEAQCATTAAARQIAKFELEGISSLHKEGYASWLELNHAEAKYQTLVKEAELAEKQVKLVQHIAASLEQLKDGNPQLSQSISEGPK